MTDLGERLLRVFDGAFHKECEYFRNNVFSHPLFDASTEYIVASQPYKPFHEFFSDGTLNFEMPKALRGFSFPDPEIVCNAQFAPNIRNLAYARAIVFFQDPLILESFRNPDTHILRGLSIGAIASMVEPGYSTKLAIHSLLFYGSIRLLGTEEQRKHWLNKQKIDDIKTSLGCFAMTELGHGSNLRCLETTAHYHPENHTFIINSPTRSSRKVYIGNSAMHAKFVSIFAQLCMQQKNPETGDIQWISHGPHCFIAKIRDDKGNILPNIQIDDCGRKLGLDSIDNGAIQFSNLVIPESALMKRFGWIIPNGADGYPEYHSNISSVSARFASMIGALTQTRISVAIGSIAGPKAALGVALKYSAFRKQFGPDTPKAIRELNWNPKVLTKKQFSEIPILDYTSTQIRIFPFLIRAMVSDVGIKSAAQDWIAISQEKLSATPETLSGILVRDRSIGCSISALKAVLSWDGIDGIQLAREVTAGAGFMSTISPIPGVFQDLEVFKTFEGDNTVLMQLVCKTLLLDFFSTFPISPTNSSSLIRFNTTNTSKKPSKGSKVPKASRQRKSSQSKLAQTFNAFKTLSISSISINSPTWIPRILAGSILDLKTLMRTIHWRKQYYIHTLASKITLNQLYGTKPFDSWNSLLPIMKGVTFSYVDSYLVEMWSGIILTGKKKSQVFTNKLFSEDAEVKSLLFTMFSLFCVDSLLRDAAFSLSNSLLSKSDIPTLETQRILLCQKLSKHSNDLVRACGIPGFNNIPLIQLTNGKAPSSYPQHLAWFFRSPTHNVQEKEPFSNSFTTSKKLFKY